MLGEFFYYMGLLSWLFMVLVEVHLKIHSQQLKILPGIPPGVRDHSWESRPGMRWGFYRHCQCCFGWVQYGRRRR